MNETEHEESTQRPPPTPNGDRWRRFCRRDDPGAATRWFPVAEPPTDRNTRSPFMVKTIIVDEDDGGCRTGVYLYWPDPAAYERAEMVGPVRLDGERVLEELWRQHPEADPLEVDTLFNDIVETMLTNHLVKVAGELRRTSENTPRCYGNIDNWSLKVEEAAARRRDWRIAHG